MGLTMFSRETVFSRENLHGLRAGLNPIGIFFQTDDTYFLYKADG
jgi:hypothetical protein